MAKPATLNSQQKLVDTILKSRGTSLREFLAGHVAEGASYELISQDLYHTTDKAVSVSYNTIKRWLIDFELLEVAS